jgi:hypothetical protein
MPLITCPDCEKSVSDSSANCIHCGCPLGGVATEAKPTVQVAAIAAAPSAYACPKCGSEETKKLSVIWRDGVQAINTGTVGVAVGLDMSVAVAGARTQGTAQNASSMIAAPPKKQDEKGIGTMFAFTLVALFGLLILPASWGGLVILLIGVGVVYGAYQSRKAKIEFNRTKHPELMRAWEHSYRCGRCENMYTVGA